MQEKLFSFRTKIVLSFLGAIGLLVLGGLTITYQRDREADNNQWLVHTYQVIEELEELQSLLVDAETGVRGYAATGEVLFLEPYQLALPRIDRKVRYLAVLIRDNPAQSKRLLQLQRLAEAKLAILNRQIERGKAVVDVTLFLEGKRRMDRIRNQVSTMIAEENRLMTVRNEQVQKSFRATNLQLAMLGGLSLFLLTVACLLILSEFKKRQQAQTDALQKEALLKKVINNVQVGIGLLQAVRDQTGRVSDFRIVLTNQTNAFLTHHSVEALTGALLTETLPGTIHTELVNAFIEVVETGQPRRIELPYRYDQLDFVADVIITRQEDGVLFSALDITLLVEVRDQLRQTNLDLVRSNESFKEFAYTASHDLQEPLRKIIQFGEVLARQYGSHLDENALRLINRSQASAKRMAQLIRGLLAYSQVGEQNLNRSSVSLTQIIEEILDDLATLAEESKAQVSYVDLPTLNADRVLLRQLFQNLLTNAIRYRKPDVSPIILLKSRLLEKGQLPEALGDVLDPERFYWEITVRDNGIGFEEQDAERIFRMFQRLHSKDKYSGSGIGLAVSQKIAQLHEGLITARSQPGQGATFYVYLPVTP